MIQARKAACFLIFATLATAADLDSPRRLAARALGDTPIFTDLQELCDRIGGRPTGSSAAQRAIEWATGKFRDAGLTSVAVEPFTIPSLWLPGTAEASAASPAQFPIRLAAAPFTASTNRMRRIVPPASELFPRLTLTA